MVAATVWAPEPHDDDDAVRLGVAGVLDEVVGAGRAGGEVVHRRCHDARCGGVERVDGLA
jgi:hypothetical protein